MVGELILYHGREGKREGTGAFNFRNKDFARTMVVRREVYQFFFIAMILSGKMAKTCRKHKKCYIRKDGKKCLAPNPWIIFLRTSKRKYPTSAAASKAYQKSFKPVLLNLIKEASKNRTTNQIKAVYHKQICKYFYDSMKASGTSTIPKKKKVSSSVAKILKKNSVPKTLAIMGAKKQATQMAAKQKAVKQASARVEAKKKAAEVAKIRARAIRRLFVRAAAKEKVLRKEAEAASAKVAKARSTGTKRKASSSSRSSSSKRVKTASKSAEKKKSAAKKAKKTASALKSSSTKASQRVKKAEKDVVAAQKARQKRALKKLQI